MYAFAFGDTGIVEDALWTLQRWPEEVCCDWQSLLLSVSSVYVSSSESQTGFLQTVDWPFRNSDRLDLPHDPEPDRSGHFGDSLRVLPPGTLM